MTILKYLTRSYRFCNNLYNKKKINKKHIIIKNLISKNLALQIIKEAEEYAIKYDWKRKRHEHYSTIDNEITEDWKYYKIIENILKNKIYIELMKMFYVKHSDIGINELFVVKYNKNQTKLDAHKDGSEFSFIIALNDEFTGGGTYFTEIDKKIHLEIGDCLLFSGQNTHSGIQIKSGKRYILTGFLHYKHKEYCENLFK